MRPTASARAPERARLAGAQEHCAEPAEELARAEAAVQKLYDGNVALRTRIASARSVVAVARAGESQIAVAVALGETVGDQPDLAEAERVLAECERGLDDNLKTRKMIEAEASRLRSVLGIAEMGLKRAVADVVASSPELATLKSEYARAMSRAAQLWRALRTAGVLGVNNIVERVSGDDADWANALGALRTDADAVLPGLPPEPPLDHARPGGRRAA